MYASFINLSIYVIWLELINLCSSSNCGSPGEPYDAYIINLSRSEKRVMKFPEDTVMVYSCKNASDVLLPNDGERYEQTFEKFFFERKCSKGKWTRSLPSCAKPIPDETVSVASITVAPTMAKMSQVDNTRLVAKLSKGCLLSEIKQWKLLLRKPTLFSYIEFDITFENKFIQDFTYQTLTKVKLNVSGNRNCYLLKARKNDYDYHPKGIITARNRKIFENYTDGEQFYSFITTIGFLCSMKKEGEVLEPYNSKEMNIDFRNLTYSIGICNVRLYHPQNAKCGRPEIPANSNAIYPSERNETTNKWRTKVTFECDQGYSLTNISEEYKQYNGSFCGFDGRYIAGVPFCEPQTVCPQYVDVAHLSIKYTDYTYYEGEKLPVKNTKVLYGCKRNKTLVGSAFQQCKADGTWSSIKPACVDSVDIEVSSVFMHESKIISWLIALLVSLIVTMCCAFFCCMYFSSRKPRINGESSSGHPILEDDEDDRYEKVPPRIYVSLNMVDGAFDNGRVITNVSENSNLTRARVALNSGEWNDDVSCESEESSRTSNNLQPVSYPLVDNTLYSSAECVN